jgi:hypothetical protein
MSVIGKKSSKSTQECCVILAWLVDSRVNNVVVLNPVLGTDILELNVITNLLEVGTYPRIDNLDFFWIDVEATNDFIS